MEVISIKLNIILSSDQWMAFVERRTWLCDQSNSSELKVRGDSFDLRRISPVPRKEFLRVFYCIAVDTVTIHRAAIISMDHSATTWTQDKLSQDIEYLFEGFLPGK